MRRHRPLGDLSERIMLRWIVAGGKGGIRTREAINLPLFESGAFNHSATFPSRRIAD